MLKTLIPWRREQGAQRSYVFGGQERKAGGTSCPNIGRLLAILLSLALFAGEPVAAAATFDLDTVEAMAKKLAAESFRDSRAAVPDWLLKITYDQWRDIRFRPEESLWRNRNLPFEVQFFHPGLFYDRVVTVSVVDAAGIHPVAFAPSLFDYGQNKFGSQVPQNLGFAGFRLHYPINRADYKDELIVFLGASYFRAVGKGLGFGLSARALAIDTALPSGEEFPHFTSFWLVRPTPQAKDIAIYALLDSRRATGAYRFVVHPGAQTIVDVDARLFLRNDVGKLGVAPLTSMFFRGENTAPQTFDYRPEVHDSDGILLAAGSGEWIWRPVKNPRRLQVNSFALPDPKGFGLLQRDRYFDHYQDLETRPDLRPSVWIVPQAGFQNGRVELVEIPTRTDTNDNVVVLWVPEERPRPGQALGFSYKMYWGGSDIPGPPDARAVATRHDRGTFDDAHRLIVDFEGGRLAKLPPETVLRGVVTLGKGGADEAELLEQQVVKNTVTGGWRLIFQVRPKLDQPLEMRAFLQVGEEALTETWSYAIEP